MLAFVSKCLMFLCLRWPFWDIKRDTMGFHTMEYELPLSCAEKNLVPFSQLRCLWRTLSEAILESFSFPLTFVGYTVLNY